MNEMMDIELAKLLLDSGLFILIWIVQMVIYPSFLYYTEQNMSRWHLVYTQRISIIVLPLMLGQLVVYCYSLFTGGVLLDMLITALIIFNWIITFTLAVPLHNKLQESKNSMRLRQRLVSVNWLRTIAWTLIFLMSLISYYGK